MSRKRLILTVVFSALTLLVVWAWSPWDSFRYHGDGEFSDRGFFAYPRYVATFSDISLNEVSEHRFHFRGLPGEEMRLVLYLKGRSVDTFAEREPLEHLKTTIEAHLTDGHGGEACHGSGQPESGERDGIWVLMSGGANGYWHANCIRVRVHPNESYTLMIRVTSTDPNGEKVVVTPKFEGGGIEFP